MKSAKRTEVIYQPDCPTCNGLCCRSVTLPIHKPFLTRNIDLIRYLLMHRDVRVGIDIEGNWMMDLPLECRFLDKRNSCSIYEKTAEDLQGVPAEKRVVFAPIGPITLFQALFKLSAIRPVPQKGTPVVRASLCTIKPGLIVLLLCCLCRTSFTNSISEYIKTTGWGSYQGSSWIVVRQFKERAAKFYLTVNPQDLMTAIVPADSFAFHPMTWDSCCRKFAATPYMNTLHAAEANSDTLQDAGIVHGYSEQKGVDLTVDLCPSHLPLDKILFQKSVLSISKRKG